MRKISLVAIAILAFCLIFPPLPVQAATFNFSPTNLEATTRCDQTLNILIDASGEDSNAADIEIHFDPKAVTILDDDATQDGVQIAQGDAYQQYWGNQVDTANGVIRLTGITIGTTFSTKATFASIHFRAVSDRANQTQFIINFDSAGNSLDSNIADASTSTDLLTAVQNAQVDFTSGGCGSAKVLGISTSVPVQVSDSVVGPRTPAAEVKPIPAMISVYSDKTAGFSPIPGLQALAYSTLTIASLIGVFKFLSGRIHA